MGERGSRPNVGAHFAICTVSLKSLDFIGPAGYFYLPLGVFFGLLRRLRPSIVDHRRNRPYGHAGLPAVHSSTSTTSKDVSIVHHALHNRVRNMPESSHTSSQCLGRAGLAIL